jgi:ornithine--oxo-acid transaminase
MIVNVGTENESFRSIFRLGGSDGLMIALELHPHAGGAGRYCDALRRRGVLCKDTHDHTIRVSPPLVITRGEIDWALEQFDAALAHPEAA